MPKLAKQMYYNAKGEKKINCYNLNIPKSIVSQTDIKDNDNVKIYVENKKIIIEKQQ